MVGGDGAAFERAKPVLLAIGPKVTHIGGNGLACQMSSSPIWIANRTTSRPSWPATSSSATSSSVRATRRSNRLRVRAKSCHSPRRNYLGGSGLLVIVAKPGEQFYTDAVG